MLNLNLFSLKLDGLHIKLLCIFSLLVSPVASQAGFTLVTQTTAQTVSVVDGQPPLIKRDTSEANSTSQGHEHSQCQPYGRQSASSALAKALETLKERDSVGVKLSTTSIAEGGHYRTCAACAFGQCIGIYGHDTKSRSVAEANAMILLKFDDVTLPGKYKVALGQSKIGQGEQATVSIKNATGEPIDAVAPGIYEVDGSPNAVYQITASIQATAENGGGCCSQTQTVELNLTFSVLVERLAEMKSTTEPFVLGGQFTKEYPQVGLITLREKNGTVTPHCTGTLIGKRTVLTAAHCVADDYETAAKEHRLRFLLGTTIDDPDAEIYLVEASSLPLSETYHYKLIKSPSGDISTVDDVAVVYLDAAATLKPLKLYLGKEPTLQSLIDSKEPLPFVGFGLYSIADDGTGGSGSGKKRQAFVPITSQDQKTFYYKVNKDGKGVCKGDSGGPALVETPAPDYWRIIGVTAYGSGNCKDGRSMKVNAFVDWVTPLIKD